MSTGEHWPMESLEKVVFGIPSYYIQMCAVGGHPRSMIKIWFKACFHPRYAENQEDKKLVLCLMPDMVRSSSTSSLHFYV